jgi:hypothetical protein
MRIVWLELLKEAIRRRFYTKIGLLLREAPDSPLFFLFPSSAEYVSPTVEMFIPYGDKLMILYSSANGGGRPPKPIIFEDGSSLKGSSFIRRWTEVEYQNKISIEILKPGDGLERRLLESTYKLLNESFGWINIGLDSELDESRGRDMVDRSLSLQPISPPLLV